MSLLKNKKAIDNELFLLKKPTEYTIDELHMLSDGLEEELNACDDQIEKLEIESTLIKLLRADLGNYSDKLREIKNDIDAELWKSEKIDVDDSNPGLKNVENSPEECLSVLEVDMKETETREEITIEEKPAIKEEIKAESADQSPPEGESKLQVGVEECPDIEVRTMDIDATARNQPEERRLEETIEQRLVDIRMCQNIRAQPGSDGMFRMLELINRAIIVDGKLDPEVSNVAMTHINYNFPVNLVGQRASRWVPNRDRNVATMKNPLRNICGKLDGEFFQVVGATSVHEFEWYPGRWMEGNIRIRTIEVPPTRHTPDFPLERIELGKMFCAKHVVAVNFTPPQIIIRCNNGKDVELRYRVRNKLRSREDGERFRRM